MQQVRLVGLDDGGTHLVLETPTGERFRLLVDERLRAACRGDLTRLGQIEIEQESTLRPREIQARVRAGESAEQVATSAGVPIARVLRFAYPVLQERERVVAEARATRVRRGHDVPTLGELINTRLIDRGADPTTMVWDAWRRDDGLWTVQLLWRTPDEHSACWTFTLATRTLTPDDPAAEQLIAAEFRVRTITPVTPLAAAAAAARGEAPSGPPAGRDAMAGPEETPEAPGRDAPPERAAARPPARPPARPRPAAEPPRPDGPVSTARNAGRPTAVPLQRRDRAPEPPHPGNTGRRGTPVDRSRPGPTASAAGAPASAEPLGTGPPRAEPLGTEPLGTEPLGTEPLGTEPPRSGPLDGGPLGTEPARGGPVDGSPLDGSPLDVEAPVAGTRAHQPPVGSSANDEGTRHAHVPSWDDIVLGVRRKH